MRRRRKMRERWKSWGMGERRGGMEVKAKSQRKVISVTWKEIHAVRKYCGEKKGLIARGGGKLEGKKAR